MTNWLNRNGYKIIDEATALFEDYIKRNWNYFFIARADTTWQGLDQNVGITFSFATDTVVYPMKISSLSSTESSSLYLYVIGEHKMCFEESILEYANKISKEELLAIEEDFLTLHDYIQEGNYITKLKKVYNSPGNMESDISVLQAPDDIEYQKVVEGYRYWYYSFTNSMIFPLLIITIYLLFAKLYRRKASK